MNGRKIFLSAAGFLLCVIGCAGRPDPYSAFLVSDYPTAVQELRKRKETRKYRHKNYILRNAELGSAAIHGGDEYDALPAFTKATFMMRAAAGGKKRGMGSLIIHENIKMFKGEPFEKGMANIYLGLLYYRRGEYDNAKACFEQALMADGMSQPEYRDDFSLAYFLAGRCYLNFRGEEDNAEICFNRAAEYWPDNPYLTLAANESSNVVAVLEMGNCPLKIRKGFEGSNDDFVQCLPYQDCRAVLSVDGEEVAGSSKILDIFHQAGTRGKSIKDAAQTTKGVFAFMLRVSAAAFTGSDPGNVGQFTGSLADIRQWWLLPGEVHIIACDIEPGQHTVTLSFYDQAGTELQGYRQVWHRVPVYPGRDNLWLFRSAPMLHARLVESDEEQAKPLKEYYTQYSHAGCVKKAVKQAEATGRQ